MVSPQISPSRSGRLDDWLDRANEGAFLSSFLLQIFFVLRKKNNHVSTLHVIHHGCMPMSVWFGVKFTPGK